MSLSLDQVRQVAALARLSLTPEEERLYQGQLSAILDAMAQLETLDTRDVEPTSHAGGEASAPFRADVLQPSLPAERALAAAPARSGTSFAVPKILE